MSAPVLVEEVRPIIPENIRFTHITQPVYLYNVVVSEAGRVTSVSLVRGNIATEPYISYERAAREAIAKRRYTPAMRAGTPVSVNITVTATFEVR